VLYRVTADTGRAEEIASEAFWRLHRKPPRDKTNLEGWLYRTGLRLALDQLRKDRRRARYEALAGPFAISANPEQSAEQNQNRERVRATLAALDVDQIALIVLRAEGFTYAEVARKLRLNPASVGTLLARAEQAFRKEYVNRYGQP
jgi:RNA polymerase sigma-70 factor (ECF subfamily)